MLRYMVNGTKRRYPEGEAPEGAVLLSKIKDAEPVEAEAPKTVSKKAVKPASNKARKAGSNK